MFHISACLVMSGRTFLRPLMQQAALHSSLTTALPSWKRIVWQPHSLLQTGAVALHIPSIMFATFVVMRRSTQITFCTKLALAITLCPLRVLKFVLLTLRLLLHLVVPKKLG